LALRRRPLHSFPPSPSSRPPRAVNRIEQENLRQQQEDKLAMKLAQVGRAP